MFRIDTSTTAAALPAPAAPGAPGYFSDGDPALGARPTTVPADWFNMIQEELLAVVLAAGVVPSKANRAQLLAALRKLPALEASLTTPGYIIHPSGFIEQWGSGACDNTGKFAVVFPIPFRNAILGALATNNANGPPTGLPGVGALTLTGMNVWSSSSSGVASGAGTSASWRAWGY